MTSAWLSFSTSPAVLWLDPPKHFVPVPRATTEIPGVSSEVTAIPAK